mmetsp:Transcript_56466/g.104553  ORF Transcript_56466/g.104553 Transcript_56466/m.104553 type:complete len:300 (+) Transcript_56466:253-1152(+)
MASSTDVATSSPPAHFFFVRNTFIDTSASPPGARSRCSSAPATCRGDGLSMDGPSGSSSPIYGPLCPPVWAKAKLSDAAGDEASSEASTQASLAFQSDSDATMGSMGLQDGCWACQESCQLPCMAPIGWVVPVAATYQPKLSAKAKSFTPQTASSQGSISLKKPDDLDCKHVVEFAREALSRTGYTAMVEMNAGTNGWSVVAWVLPQFLCFVDIILTEAKNALLQGAAESKSIFVIGYDAWPFLQTPYGFSAVLGAMEDERQACWDFFSTGTCSRQGKCRWRHPVCKRPVEVEVRLWQE